MPRVRHPGVAVFRLHYPGIGGERVENGRGGEAAFQLLLTRCRAEYVALYPSARGLFCIHEMLPVLDNATAS